MVHRLLMYTAQDWSLVPLALPIVLSVECALRARAHVLRDGLQMTVQLLFLCVLTIAHMPEIVQRECVIVMPATQALTVL
jgi:hypothetical protein